MAADARTIGHIASRLAVLEVDGSISVLKYDDIAPTATTHLNRRRFLKKN